MCHHDGCERHAAKIRDVFDIRISNIQRSPLEFDSFCKKARPINLFVFRSLIPFVRRLVQSPYSYLEFYSFCKKARPISLFVFRSLIPFVRMLVQSRYLYFFNRRRVYIELPPADVFINNIRDISMNSYFLQSF